MGHRNTALSRIVRIDRAAQPRRLPSAVPRAEAKRYARAAPPDVSLPAIAARPLVNAASGTVRLAALWLDWVCGDRSEKRWLLLLFDSNEENQALDIKA